MSAGAFSSDEAAKAAEELVAIKVDCTDEDQNVEIQEQYDIQGYPTVLFVTNEEKMIEDLFPDDGRAFAKQIRSFASKHTPWIRGWEGAISLGARRKKPVVILKPEQTPEDWDAEKSRFKDHLDEFVFGWSERGTKEREKLDTLTGDAEFIVVDPRVKEPFKTPLADSPDSLKQVLQDWKKE